MSKQFRSRRNGSAYTTKEDSQMADAVATETPVHESKKVKAVEFKSPTDGETSTQKVDAKFGNVEGSITYPRNVAKTIQGAIAIVQSLGLKKTVGEGDSAKEVPMEDQEAVLKFFNAGYDASQRLTARNELAVLIEGPEKQIDAIAKRIAKFKFGEDSEEAIKKVKALPEFNSLVAMMG